MPVISLANAKGGAGKTTAALLLATEFAHQGHRVMLIDADPQRWISCWSDLTGPVANIEVISEVTPSSITGHIKDGRERGDYVIVDCAGARDQMVATVLALSDHVLIPVQGCAMDARGAALILDLLQQMRERAGIDIAHSVVLTRVSTMVTTRAMLAIKTLLASRGVNVLNTALAERSAYRDIFDCGGTLYGMDPQRASNLDRAIDNARTLAGEVLGLLPARIVRPREKSFFRFGRAA